MKIPTIVPLIFAALMLPALSAISLEAKDNTAVPAAIDGPIKEALTAFNEGRHVKAIDLAKPLAEKGNSDAMFLLGFAHETGRGLESSREKALELYQKASKAGQKDATYRLALILLSSKEDAEREQGRKNLEEAASKDPGNAGRILGEAYIKGVITGKPDFDQAVKWWTSASEAGDVPSVMALARIYDGVDEFKDKKNPKKAIELFQKAIVLGDKSAMVAVGSRLLNGDESIRDEKAGRDMLAKAIEEKLNDAYLALGDYEESTKKNPKEALAKYEKGGDEKQIDCALRAADFYLEGREGIEKDEAKGTEWLAKAAAIGHPVGSYRYAAKLIQPPDPDNRKDEEKFAAARKAYDHLLNAANGNIPQAQNDIALFYLQGMMGVADPSAAAGWFQRSAQNGNASAMANLAALYEKGYGVAQNFSQAGQLYEAAARGGSSAAAAAVARLMAGGMGTKRNIPHAWAWANYAIQEGSQEAKAILGEISTIASTKDTEEGKEFLEKLRAEIAKAKEGKPADEKKPADEAAKPADEAKPADTAPEGDEKPKDK